LKKGGRKGEKSVGWPSRKERGRRWGAAGGVFEMLDTTSRGGLISALDHSLEKILDRIIDEEVNVTIARAHK
jgi:hypothetical protein